MGRVILAAVLWGMAGFFAAPAIVFALSLGLGGGCGAPGDSGGCAKAAFPLAIAAAVPGFALLFLVPVAREFVRRRSGARRVSPPEPTGN